MNCTDLGWIFGEYGDSGFLKDFGEGEFIAKRAKRERKCKSESEYEPKYEHEYKHKYRQSEYEHVREREPKHVREDEPEPESESESECDEEDEQIFDTVSCEICMEKGIYRSFIDDGKKYCKKHKTDGMIFASDGRCINILCRRYARYGYRGVYEKIYCSMHKTPSSIIIRCFAGCDSRGKYKFRGSDELFCSAHKKPGMMSTKIKHCSGDVNCTNNPKYGSVSMVFCEQHKLPEMKQVIKNICVVEGCSTFAYYFKDGDRNTRYCLAHKQIGMLSKNNLSCTVSGCGLAASYGVNGIRLYCSGHRSSDSVCLNAKLCSFLDCRKIAKYKDLDKTEYVCEKHKKPGMIKIRFNKCTVLECRNIAKYSCTSKGNCMYCIDHMTDNMYNKMRNICRIGHCTNTVYRTHVYCEGHAT